MPYHQPDGVVLADGLYVVKQKSKQKGVDHYGILDVGNRLRIPGVDGINPVIVHQTPPHIQASYLHQTGWWANHGRIADEAGAIGRLQAALGSPKYDLVFNNCEHFVRYVVTGQRESTQVQMGVLAVAVGVVVVWAVASTGEAA
jgi:Lecithin retinol acyltransferase